MPYETYEEFSNTMTDILSSGNCIEFTPWHKRQIAELVDGMDRDSVIEFLNIFYSTQTVSEIMEGELSWIAEHVNNMNPSSPPISAKTTIIFS
jgi:hypothetical protein